MDKYIGIPFALGGRTEEGCDCYGLVRLFYKDYFNIELPEYNLYDRFDNILLYTLIDTNIPLLDFSKVEYPVYGDIGLFKFFGVPTHLGIFLKNDKVLHIMRGSDAVIERIDSHRLKGRFAGWYRKKQ